MKIEERPKMRNWMSNLVIASIATMLLAGCAAAATPETTSGATATASTASPASGASAAAPSASTALPSAVEIGGPPVALTSGSAHVTMTGGTSQEFDLSLSSGILIPGSNVILSWSGPPGDESGNDGLRIQAPSRAGVYQSAGGDFTAPQISVTTGRVGTAGVPPQFAPVADECTLTLAKVDATGVEGTLDCRGLTSTEFDKPIDLSATYTTAP